MGMIWVNGSFAFMLWPWLERGAFFAGLLCVLSVAGMLFKRLDGPIISDFGSMMKRLWRSYVAAPLSQIFRMKSRGTASYAPVWFAVFCCAALLYGATRIQDAPIVEKHNVAVLKQVAHNKWLMLDEQGKFLYTGCDDFPNDNVIWAGYIAKTVRWQEFGSCKSIRRQDLGFWWLRDDHFNAKEIR